MDDRTAPAGRYPRDIGLGAVRHDWTREEVRALFDLPFPELIFRAQAIHRCHFDPNEVQISTLLSIKTGGCPEDCAYCPQSVHYDTGVKAEKLMAVDAVLAEARAAKSAGASRFCMGAAWREPKDRDLDKVCEMVAGVKAAGLETCATLGMLTGEQAQRLKAAGLDYYNHNLDTSADYYGAIITTRTYEERLHTLDRVRAAGIHVFTMKDIDRDGIATVAERAIALAARDTGGIHVSFDMDVCDPAIAPGVGTPVKGGFDYREAHMVMELVADSGQLVALDLVEVNPTLDIRNTTAEFGTELALSALGKGIL